MARSRVLHVLLFPYPSMGHMLSLLELAQHLSAHGFAVTVVVTPKNLPLLDPLLSRSPSVQPLLLPLPDTPFIPSGVENGRELPVTRFGAMMHAVSGLRDPILQWARCNPSPPSVIVSDLFLGWTTDLADELGIPRLLFVPCGALGVSVIQCLWRDMPKRPDPQDDHFPVSFPSLPKSPTYPWCQLSTMFRNYQEGEFVSEFMRKSFVANLRSWGIVCNTFDALERPYLEHMRSEQEHSRVWAVGPLIPLDGPTAERGGPSSVPLEDVVAWLDAFARGSVVYVCFGSHVVLSLPQVEAVAAALERSLTRFVWCVKRSTAGGGGETVPDGFDERVAGRGLVIRGWAPQVAILSHPAVGSFVTHCGWNSVLEGITAGVALLAWPMGADQYTNARLLEEDMGVAVRVCEGRDAVPDPDELARAIVESVDETRPQRISAGELRNKALEALREGGSSYKDLEALVDELSKLKSHQNPHKQGVIS